MNKEVLNMTKFKQALNIAILTIVFGWASILSSWAQQPDSLFILHDEDEQTLIWDADSTESTDNDSTLTLKPEAADVVETKTEAIALPQFVKVPFSDSIPEALKFNTFSFYLNTSIQYQHISQFRTTDGLTQYIEGWKQEQNLKHTLQQTDSLRKIYEQIFFDEEREKIAEQLLKNEMEVLNSSQLPESCYIKAREAELNWWKTAPRSEFQTFSEETTNLVRFIDSLKPKPAPEPEPIVEPIPADSTIVLNDSLAMDTAPAPIVPKNESTVIYKVQIGTFTKTVPPQTQKKFDKLAVLRRIDQTTDENGTLIFSVGELTHFNDAVNMQNQIRQEGIKDAFVVSYLNGKRIPLNEAKKITEK
jgi:hypothetical protein